MLIYQVENLTYSIKPHGMFRLQGNARERHSIEALPTSTMAGALWGNRPLTVGRPSQRTRDMVLWSFWLPGEFGEFRREAHVTYCNGMPLFVMTLRPRQDGRHFADDTRKCISLNKNIGISIKISLKFSKGPIKNIPALVQVMACRRPGDKTFTEPMVVTLLTHICVTRPQWVKVPWTEKKESQLSDFFNMKNTKNEEKRGEAHCHFFHDFYVVGALVLMWTLM